MPRQKVNNRDKKCFTRGKLGQYLSWKSARVTAKFVNTYVFIFELP